MGLFVAVGIEEWASPEREVLAVEAEVVEAADAEIEEDVEAEVVVEEDEELLVVVEAEVVIEEDVEAEVVEVEAEEAVNQE